MTFFASRLVERSHSLSLLNIETIYEDDFLLVLNKTCGLVVNKSRTTKDFTLQDYLLDKLTFPQGNLDEQSQIFVSRAGLAHRLDKETSGVIVVAKNPSVLANLMSQFQSREVVKTYLALVHGVVLDPIIAIDAPIARNPRNRLKFAIVKNGKPSRTLIRLIKNFEEFSLVSAEPKTGRTHQIRIHLAGLNHPVAGDSLYCPGKLLEQDLNLFGRLMLHAWKIGFLHPNNNKKVQFEAKIPSEFANFLK